MARATALAFAAALLIIPVGASAQTIELGPRGPAVDFRGPGQRERDIRRDERMRERERQEMRREERRAERRAMERDSMRGRGGPGCRTVTVRERDEYGRMITRTREECRR